MIAALVAILLVGQQFFAASAVQWHVTFLKKVNSLLDGSLRALPILLRRGCIQSRLHPVINRIFQPVDHVGKHTTILPPPALKKTLADPSVYHRSPCFVAAVQVAKAGTISALPTHKLSSGVTTWSTYRDLA